MTVALLLIIILCSVTIVRVGAFALELTGLPWEQAKFQALSAFSTTGYTTREAEHIVSHPMRRRIVSMLIVLGNAGIVTAVGTFAGTMSAEDPVELGINAGVLLVGVVIVFAVLRHDGITGRLRRRVQSWLQKRYDFEPPRPDELLHLDEGYELTRIQIDDKSPVRGRTLAELKLSSWRVQVLAIERNAGYYPVPGGHDRLLAGDHIVVYGAEDAIMKVFKPRTRTRLTLLGKVIRLQRGFRGRPVGPRRARMLPPRPSRPQPSRRHRVVGGATCRIGASDLPHGVAGSSSSGA